VLWLFLPFGGFLGLDGQQGHDGNDQSDSPRDSRGKVLDPEGIHIPNQQIDDKGPLMVLLFTRIPHNHIWFSLKIRVFHRTSQSPVPFSEGRPANFFPLTIAR